MGLCAEHWPTNLRFSVLCHSTYCTYCIDDEDDDDLFYLEPKAKEAKQQHEENNVKSNIK